MRIRDAEVDDLAEVSEIYGYSVKEETASFEITPPTAEEMISRWRAITEAGYPYLVAMTDGGVVGGYCYASAYRPRPAYRKTVECSVYVDRRWRRQGVARHLMGDLIDACRARSFEQMIAVISDPEQSGSVSLHTSLGFRSVGTLYSVGRKFDQDLDVALMQKAL